MEQVNVELSLSNDIRLTETARAEHLYMSKYFLSKINNASFYIGVSSNGSGRETYVNGDVYVGEFRNGKREGYGRYTVNLNSSVYTGMWNDGVRSGIGSVSYIDGHQENSFWENDIKLNSLTCGDGVVETKGYWFF